MDSWYDLGEGSGHSGAELELRRITCPFCNERGSCTPVYQAEKRKPNSGKTLHFDTLKCANCAGYVLVLWSAGEYATSLTGLYDYRVLPWPLRLDDFPDYWPPEVGRYCLQAHRSIKDENWDAAAMMARSSLQVALRDQGATGSNLKQEIDDLAFKGVLPPIMKEWAHEVRELANDSAHPEPGQPATDPKDARDLIQFLDFLLEVTYGLPHRIKQYRGRR